MTTVATRFANDLTTEIDHFGLRCPNLVTVTADATGLREMGRLDWSLQELLDLPVIVGFP